MAYRIADGQWLLQIKDERILVSDVIGNSVYTCERADEAFMSKLKESDQSNSRLHCDPDTSSVPHILQLNLTSVLPNGLELKPLQLQLTRSDVSLTDVIIELTTTLAETRQKLSAAELELEKATTVNQTLVEEKVRYQDVMLDKVCAILEERNVWIDKMKNLKHEGSGN